VLVIGAGLLALRYAVDAERKPLEEIAPPLSTEAAIRIQVAGSAGSG